MNFEKSKLLEMLQEGLFYVNKPREVSVDFSPQDIELIETRLKRYEGYLNRALSTDERIVYYSAFCSAMVAAGEILRGYKPTR